MKTFKEFSKQDNFYDYFSSSKPSKIIKTTDHTLSKLTIILYRGFDADLKNLQQDGDQYILSPEKSEQKSIWFSRNLQDAEGRGKWILTYPLTTMKHFIRNYTQDGNHFEEVPEEIRQQTDPTKNSRFYNGIELPEGWYWSYKVEKYIIATIPIHITKDMIRKDHKGSK